MADFLVDVRCRGCRRQIGLAKKDATPVFCDLMCATDYPAVATEARDALAEAVYGQGRYTFEVLGKMFGFTRQRAQQVIALRDIRRNP